MVDKIKEIHRDKAMTQQLEESLNNFVKDIAGQWAMNGTDTTGVKTTRNLISLYFQALEDTYGTKKKPEVDNPE